MPLSGPDSEFVKFLMTLGVGGILAGMMFFFYRRDVQNITQLWKTQTEMLVTVVSENTKSNLAVTQSNEQIAAMLTTLHQRLDMLAYEQRDHNKVGGQGWRSS